MIASHDKLKINKLNTELDMKGPGGFYSPSEQGNPRRDGIYPAYTHTASLAESQTQADPRDHALQ